MPELPEVEVVRAGLAPAVIGATVSGVSVLDDRALTRHVGTAAMFETELTGAVIREAARRGKFLWLPLDSGRALVGHLGMSGQLLLRTPGAAPERHERVRLTIEHPDHGELAVVFSDQRTFGSLAIDDVVPTADGLAAGWGSARPVIPTQVAHIARDPMDPAFDVRPVIARIRRSRSGVKRALLDQTVVSGIGNIYADEALWAARIHPETPGERLSSQALTRLFAEVRTVLEKALAEGGTSFDAQYVNVNGQAGYFSHSLNAYGRHGYPCPRCGTTLVRAAFANRGSHFCPKCQRRR